jgi:hypothetical protein
MKNIVFFLFILLLCFLLMTKPTSAQSLIFEDDFSNGFEKWQIARGDMSMWSIDTAKAKATVVGGSTITELIPKDQYWGNNWKNYEYSFEYTPIAGVDRNLGFGFQDVNNWYEIHFVEKDFNLVRLKDGVVTLNLFKPYVLQNGKSYQMRIRFEDGHIMIFVDNQQIVDEVDWSFNDNYGRISLKAGTGASAPTIAQFDNVIVRSVETTPIDGKQLNVPLFKQTDPAWKDEDYDHARDWDPSTPSIRRWGCALTSAAMILRYHGITSNEDAQILNPSTLNTWLSNQPDGYISGGVNFVAITRFTRIMSEILGTPKLEYSRAAGDQEIAKSEIAADKPAMIEIPGHFLVGSGITGDGSTLYIKDPAYIYTKLNQHKEALVSVRKFQPSHTDLSYILVAHQPGIHVDIVDAGTQQPITNTEHFTEQIQEPVDRSGATSPLTSIDQIAKPTTGKFGLKIWQDKPGKFAVQVFAYDQAASPTLFTDSGFVGKEPRVLTLDYQKNQTSTIAHPMTFAIFRQDLKLLKDLGFITRTQAYQQLDSTAAYGAQVPVAQQSRYYQLLQTQVRQNQPYISATARDFLNKDLSDLGAGL